MPAARWCRFIRGEIVSVRINATVDPIGPNRFGIRLWRVTVWNIDDEAERSVYTFLAPSDDQAAQIGMRRFLAERADATERALDVRSDGTQPEQH
jgi:hypothetical protein